jgi:small ligand-binding sensory domain FIST
VPLLEHWNILKYSEELKAAVAGGQVISTGARRGAMRAACVEGVRQHGCVGVGAEQVDDAVDRVSRWALPHDGRLQ